MVATRRPAGLALTCMLGLALARPLTIVQAQNEVPPPSTSSAETLFAPPPPPPAWYAESVNQLNAWLRWYGGLPESMRKAATPAAVAVAAYRRGLMSVLVQGDPRTAIALALTPDERRPFPASVQSKLERFVDATGTFNVDLGCDLLPLKGGRFRDATLARSIEVKAERFSAHVYGRREGQPTKIGLPIHGVALDGHLALHEDPFRILDPGEALLLGFPQGQIVAISGDRVYILGQPFEIQNLRIKLIGLESRLGPLIGDIFPPPWTLGRKNVLVVRVDFDDRPGPPMVRGGVVVDDGVIRREMGAASEFFSNNSQGATYLYTVALPDVLRVPDHARTYAAGPDPWLTVRDAGLEAARAYDAIHGGTGLWNPDRYDRVAVVFTNLDEHSGGKTSLGGHSIGFSGAFHWQVIVHEFGHTYGFTHASFWLLPRLRTLASRPLDASGSHEDRGDPVDPMALEALSTAHHFNAFFKRHALWFGAADVEDASDLPPGGRVIRLYAHDVYGTGVRTIRIDAGPARIYWLEWRRGLPADPALSLGLEVRYEIPPAGPGEGYRGIRLLDMDATTYTKDDHPLAPGQIFHDAEYRLYIQNQGSGVDSTGRPYLDVGIWPAL